MERGRNWSEGLKENLCPNVLRAHTGTHGPDCGLLFTSSSTTGNTEPCAAWGQLHITQQPKEVMGTGYRTAVSSGDADRAGREPRTHRHPRTCQSWLGAEAGGSLRVHLLAVLHNLQVNALPSECVYSYVTAGL